ncbi:nucleolar protein dao-5 [Drosophila biarmipes]|uniref:nucleolar protein dao-5 n=1 Tax=Drosophila biarmipes TaxID=125945 RepID=UPI0007E7ED4A|nr:nucleolar protein dao-5 [Drosophila biarmipes]
MESNIDKDAIDVGVLAPNDQENEDANRNAEISAAAGTPVARKTRRAVLRRMNATSEKESPTHPDPPKTPGSPGNLRPATETPRRSCRKSVRPAIDYDDIIVRSAKKVIAETLAADPEDGEPSTHKWSSAEVGRNSRKRSRKSKRMATKKQKTEKEMPEDKIEEKQETELVVPEEKAQDPKATTEVPTDLSEEVGQLDEPQAADSKEQNQSKYNKVAEADIDELGLSPLEMDTQDDEPDIQAGETTLNVPQDKNEEDAVEVEAKLSTVEDNDGQKHEEKYEKAGETTQPADQNEEETVAHEQTIPEEEMPPLLMETEDLDEPEKSPLNTTYDAEEKIDADESVILVNTSHLDASVILVVSPDKEPEACVPKPEIPEEKPAIKVVLTTADDQDETLLNLANVASPKGSKPRKSKGFRFPTPYKAKPMFNFTETVEKFDKRHMIKDFIKPEEPKYERKRSKSASDWNNTMSRTVSFHSPIEIANVEDIDKRWKGLQKTNVNNRRRRSKSLDENRCKASRIPKPSKGVIPLNRTITPSKVNKRTKMPNFAAMHEKQFAKMESLLDHVERKAERAKVLTNSVQKQLPGPTAKKAQSSSSVEERPRPKALKKIDMTADRSMVIEHPLEKLNSSRLPLKTTAPALNVAPKPAFNLSTSTVKTFNAPKPAFNLSTSTVKTFNATFSSRPADSQDNKLAERRQRRIEMFKGRTTKDQKEKGEFIRGVRLNRRFELQMQHRRHLEEE